MLLYQGYLGERLRACRCAGTCQYTSTGGCKIKLSEPILKLRPPEDLKETLLHEMIHAYVFLRKLPGAGPDGHGPPFKERMKLINESTMPDIHRPDRGYHITIYHTLHDEVNYYRVHWWECDR
jgi:SprT-like domain-contaning protein Spartan